MKLGSRITLATLAILIALALPAQAQDNAGSVSFGGVGFTVDERLGSSVNVASVPAEESSGDGGPVGTQPPHVTFTLYGERSEGARLPAIGSTPAVVRVYRTADLMRYEEAPGELEKLQALLTERPDLEAYTEATEGHGEQLPHLPLGSGALQAIRARAAYVDTSELAAIIYLVAYRLALDPFAAGDFEYTFQALSADGTWYVSGDVRVEAGMFPERVRPRDFRQAERWLAYVADSVEALNEAAPEAFAPSLSSIDALVGSITFEGADEMERSPRPTSD